MAPFEKRSPPNQRLALRKIFAAGRIRQVGLAIAHNGKFLRLPAVAESELDFLKEHLRVWSNGTYEERKAALGSAFMFIEKHLPELLRKTKSEQAISFITRGVPYGLLPLGRPTTHYFPFSSLGINVCSGMLKSLHTARCPVVIIVDPNKVGLSEFELLRDTFGKAGYHLRLAYGDNATVTSARYLTQHLPCDFLFFSTHCGEVEGQRASERFPDRHGVQHEICYNRLLSLSPSPEFIQNPSPDGLVEALFMYFPISMDDVDWNDDAGKEKIKAGELLEDFINYARAHKEGSESRQFLGNIETVKVNGFEGLQMADGIYLPVHEDIGACHYPVVFNNACCSWRTLAKNFGCSGAAVYIGTGTDVNSFLATDVASSFAKSVTSGKCVGVSIFRALKDYPAQLGYTPYLMHGYFYTKLNNPNPRQSHRQVCNRCLYAIRAASRLPETRHKQFIIAFLRQELEGLSRITIRPPEMKNPS